MIWLKLSKMKNFKCTEVKEIKSLLAPMTFFGIFELQLKYLWFKTSNILPPFIEL